MTKKRCVGYVLRKFPVLSETFILNEILALEARGVEVHVFALAPTRDPRFHEGVGRMKATIHYVPGAPSDLKTLLRHARLLRERHPRTYRKQLLKAIATGRPSLLWEFLRTAYVAERARRAGVTHLHAHFANGPATVAQQAAGIIAVPFSFTAHAFDIYRDVNRRTLANKINEARFTVTVSRYNVDYLKSVANGGRGRIELIRNGIDLARFTPPPCPPEGPFTILAVARLVEKKGLALLIEACRGLRDRELDFRCEIVGKGAQKAELEQLIRTLDLRDCVRLTGPLPHQEIVERYHRAHVLVLPCIVGRDGNRDGLPVSIVEALACGLPVISTDVTGIPEVVQHGRNGLIVRQGNVTELTMAMERLIRDPRMLEGLRDRARPSVAEEFDERRTAAQLHALLEEEAA